MFVIESFYDDEPVLGDEDFPETGPEESTIEREDADAEAARMVREDRDLTDDEFWSSVADDDIKVYIGDQILEFVMSVNESVR